MSEPGQLIVSQRLLPGLPAVTDRQGHPIPLDGRPDARFFTASGTLIAVGNRRVVVGGKGAYLEFGQEHILLDAFHIPARQRWRLRDANAYYVEYRSRDESDVKLYHQKRLVEYADYRIGLYYVAPDAVVMEIAA